MTTSLRRTAHETALVQVIRDIAWQLNRGDLTGGLAIARAAVRDEPSALTSRGVS